ncbi:ABC transporter permease, partial [Streptomyces exfoliatus]|uniref:ABC transporter permease n=1 Tax=Streptomyces exfoliatus TaxID=1905 RepID=UPI0004C8B1FA
FRTALRNVLAHKARLLMTVLAVMLGVAFVSGTLVFTDTLGNAFRNQSKKSYDQVAVAVTTWAERGDEETSAINEATLRKIRELDGVADATGRVSGFAGVADPDGKLIGNGWSNTGANFAPGKDGEDASYVFTDGSGPAKNGTIALDKDTANKGEYKV